MLDYLIDLPQLLLNFIREVVVVRNNGLFVTNYFYLLFTDSYA